MDKIEFNFETGEVTVRDDNGVYSVIEPSIKNRKEEIIKAAGLVKISGEELADDIDNLFKELGINAVAERQGTGMSSLMGAYKKSGDGEIRTIEAENELKLSDTYRYVQLEQKLNDLFNDENKEK